MVQVVLQLNQISSYLYAGNVGFTGPISEELFAVLVRGLKSAPTGVDALVVVVAWETDHRTSTYKPCVPAPHCD